MTATSKKVTSERALEKSWVAVRKLAEQHPDEWEGQYLEGEAPLRVFARAGTPRRVLVVTKEAPVSRWERFAWPTGLVVVVASGRQSRAQAGVVGRLASVASGPVAFVADADPMGLHTFLSLSTHLGPERVRFCGMCDAVLDAIDDERVQPEELSTVAMSAFDQAQLGVVASLTNPEDVLGPRVSALLRCGKKLEIEALSFRADLTPALFNAALKLANRRDVARSRATRRAPGSKTVEEGLDGAANYEGLLRVRRTRAHRGRRRGRPAGAGGRDALRCFLEGPRAVHRQDVPCRRVPAGVTQA